MTKQTLIILLLSIFVSFTIFGNGLRGDFVYDDTFGIANRQDLKDPRNIFKLFVSPYYFQQPEIGLYRPLSMSTYLLNFILFGNSPSSFKITNILLHALTSFMVFILLKQLTSSFKISLIASALFLFHPIHTEAVTLIVGRAELLATLFGLLTIYLTQKNRFLLASLSFLLALFSKEIAVVTLPILLFVEWAKKGRLNELLKPNFFINYLPFLIPMLIYFFLRYITLGKYILNARATDFIENPLGFVSLPEKIFTAFKVLYLYFEKLVFPLELTNDYSYKVIDIVRNPFESYQTILGIFAFIALIILGFYKKFRSSPLGVGAILFLLPYLVISNLFITTGTIMAERLIYFSSVGFVVVFAYLLVWLEKRFNLWKETIWITLAVIVLLFSLRTIIRNEDWLTNDKLYAPNLKNHPEGFLTQLYWGTAFLGRNEIERGKNHLALAKKIYPDTPKLIITYGSLAEFEGDDVLAEKYYKEAIDKYDLAIEAYSKLGYLYFTQGRYKEAEENLLRAIELYPTPSDASYYARAQIELGEPERGIDVIHKYFGQNPQDIELVTALGYSYYLKEDYEKALPYLERSKSLGNTNPEVENMIAIARAILENQKPNQ